MQAFAFFYLFSTIFVVVLGVPTFLLLRPFRPGHWWSVAAAGFLLGVLAAVIMRSPNNPNSHDFISFGPIGAATAVVFWLIWRYGA